MDPVSILVNLGASLINKLFPDPAQAADAKLKLLEMQQTGELAQMTAQTDTNKVEAANPSVFVAGWRPFVGWVCGMACGWNWVGLPIATFVSHSIGHPVDLPQASLVQMLPILMGMLGLGSLRTYEKTKGVDTKGVSK